MSPLYPDQEELRQVLQAVWRDEQAIVNQFALGFADLTPEEVSGGWVVPVDSKLPSFNAYDLARAISKLQEAVDRRLADKGYPNAYVNLYLNPGIENAA